MQNSILQVIDGTRVEQEMPAFYYSFWISCRTTASINTKSGEPTLTPINGCICDSNPDTNAKNGMEWYGMVGKSEGSVTN